MGEIFFNKDIWSSKKVNKYAKKIKVIYINYSSCSNRIKPAQATQAAQTGSNRSKPLEAAQTAQNRSKRLELLKLQAAQSGLNWAELSR